MSGRELSSNCHFRERPLGEVDAFSIQDLKCFFGSNDHLPHHFEVLKRGEWVIRVFFLRTNRKRGLNWEYKKQWRGREATARELEAIYELVLQNKRRLLREWNEKVCVTNSRREITHEHKQKSPGGSRG